MKVPDTKLVADLDSRRRNFGPLPSATPLDSQLPNLKITKIHKKIHKIETKCKILCLGTRENRRARQNFRRSWIRPGAAIFPATEMPPSKNFKI